MSTASVPPIRARRRLDRATVVAAACQLLDDEGLDALTMSRLGERLGVTSMALYRHVTDRRDLEMAVVEFVLGDLAEPDHVHASWADGVVGWMHQVRRHRLEHPWLGSLLGTRTELSPPWLAAIDRLARLLAAAGFPPRVVARELVRISRVTTGIVVLELAAPLADAQFSDAMVESLPAGERHRWRSLARALASYGDEDLFDDIVASTIQRLTRFDA
jgi:AcrR family transcriptional regulator